VLFLLNTMDLIRFDQIIRWWPVGLIALGVYMLYCRISGNDPERTVPNQEAQHEGR
jgi:hypothetical protein